MSELGSLPLLTRSMMVGGCGTYMVSIGIPSILLQIPTTYMTTLTVDTRIQSTYHARPAKYHARHTMVPAQSHRSAVPLMLDKEKYSIARTCMTGSSPGRGSGQIKLSLLQNRAYGRPYASAQRPKRPCPWHRHSVRLAQAGGRE
jgi:hypothetical protein